MATGLTGAPDARTLAVALRKAMTQVLSMLNPVPRVLPYVQAERLKGNTGVPVRLSKRGALVQPLRKEYRNEQSRRF